MSNILITGATGTTGRQITEALLARGESVTVGVRDVAKASDLVAEGARAVVYDHGQPDSLAAALGGIDRVYLLTPFLPGFEAQAKEAVAAATKAGVSFILKVSALGADPGSEFWPSRSHGASEQAVKDSGVAWTIVRPTFFMDNLINFAGDTIRAQGTFFGAAKDQKISYVSSRDIAAVCAEILANPDAHNGKTYTLTGPEALTNHDLAALVTETTGRTVTYTDVPGEQLADGMKSAGAPSFMIEAIVGFEAIKANGWGAEVSPDVEQVLGRKGEIYAEFLARNKQRLS